MYRKEDKNIKYGTWSDVFQYCEYKTFDDLDKKENKAYYVKKKDRSTHNYAFTRKRMMLIVTVVFDLLLEKLIEGEMIKTPLGIMEIRKYKCDYKEVAGKYYNQLNMLNYKVRLFVRGNYYEKRNITKLVFNQTAYKKVYDTIIDDTGLLFNYLTQISYTKLK